MNKLKLFIENFLVYGVGGVISKMIPLIMVPIVTRLMPNSEYYGISDLSNTLVQIGSAIGILGMYDAMYRLFFEKEDDEYKKNVCSTTMIFTLITSLLVFIVMLVLKDVIAKYFFGDVKYINVVYLSAIATFAGATNGIISAPTRMQNKRKVFLVTNTLSPIISYSISIPLLLAGHYVIALPLAYMISVIVMEIAFGVMNKSWFEWKRFDTCILKQLVTIAIPLFPNFLIYWLFNSCDKIMITNLIGVDAAGVYAVGSKLGQCSQLIYTAFAGGWQYFAFSTMKENDQVKTNSKVFEYLGVISFGVTLFVFGLSYLIFKILFTEEYLAGYIIAPYLFLAPLLQMLFQVASNQFLVVKKTWPNMIILFGGAIINIIINFKLIPIWGIEGASIATLVGYAISNIVCVLVLCKMKLMTISSKFVVTAVITITYIIAWRFLFSMNTIVGTVVAFFLVLIFAWIYKEDLLVLLKLIKKR